MSEETSLASNESFALNLVGLLNVAALKGALGDLVERHEALRTTFSADGLTLCVSDAGQRNVAFLLLAFLGILFTIDRVSRKLLFKLFLLLLLLGSIAHFFRPLAYTLLLVTGRNRVCAFDEAVDGFYGKHDEQEKIRHHIERSTRRVEIDPEGFELWATSRGSFWMPPGSESMVLWLFTEMERGIYSVGDVRVRPNDTVLDCGAHVGLFTKEALAAGARSVVAIEPSPDNLVCLRRNLADEIADGRVLVSEKGVWDKEDVLTLHSVPGFSVADGFVTDAEGENQAQVPLTTIDRLVDELGLQSVDFIKMNIEGAEQKALSGARLTLSRFKPRLAISASHLPDDWERIPQLVRQAWTGYQMNCGACYVDDKRFLILPEVLFFY